VPWVCLDDSPRHNRRWCVSADCGNRNRVREYRVREYRLREYHLRSLDHIA
jgi:predicted RNA-binding Zn ribbon-like protein